METATPGKVAAELNPVPGFCVKSRATNDALIHLTASDQPPDVHVTKGLKIFVNITWDPNVPPPPPASDDAIRRATQGLDTNDSNPEEAWFVPIVLSDARQDSDKGRCYSLSVHIVRFLRGHLYLRSEAPLAPSLTLCKSAGQSAIVFDCVLNPSIKSRSLKDPDFKNFIIGIHLAVDLISVLAAEYTPELAFQRIEAQTTLVLSRQIGTPNIASKGKPQSRRMLIPAALYLPDHPHRRAPGTLVQEIPDRSTSVFEKAPPKSILKKKINSEAQIPAWSWAQQGSRIRIVFDVPGIVSKPSPPPARCI